MLTNLEDVKAHVCKLTDDDLNKWLISLADAIIEEAPSARQMLLDHLHEMQGDTKEEEMDLAQLEELEASSGFKKHELKTRLLSQSNKFVKKLFEQVAANESQIETFQREEQVAVDQLKQLKTQAEKSLFAIKGSTSKLEDNLSTFQRTQAEKIQSYREKNSLIEKVVSEAPCFLQALWKQVLSKITKDPLSYEQIPEDLRQLFLPPQMEIRRYTIRKVGVGFKRFVSKYYRDRDTLSELGNYVHSMEFSNTSTGSKKFRRKDIKKIKIAWLGDFLQKQFDFHFNDGHVFKGHFGNRICSDKITEYKLSQGETLLGVDCSADSVVIEVAYLGS